MDFAQAFSPAVLMQRLIVRLLPLAWILGASCANATDVRWPAVVQSVGGVYGSVYVHELGHALALKALDASDIDIQVPSKGKLLSSRTTANLTAPPSPAQAQMVAVSGLFAQSLASELVLRKENLHHSPFATAVLSTGTLTNLVHVYRYYTEIRGKNGYAGNDIDQYELAGGNPHLLSAILLTYSVSSLRRMKGKNIPFFIVHRSF